MRFIGQGRKRFVAAAAAMMLASGIGMAVGSTQDPGDNAMSMGKGVNEFGMTQANFKGKTTEFTYTKGFFCDTSVAAASTTGCEAGTKFNHLPPRTHDFDPLYITVPLGFAIPRHKMECPDGLVCVDHPGTIDLTRLEPALKPLYPSLSDEQLTEALKNYSTPGHQHFITTRAGGKKEWWDVRIVGVLDKKLYNNITAHHSARYLKQQIAKKSNQGKITGVIRSNIFLFFGVK
ncbi:MAG: hypothetical protein ACTHNS_01205 [Marmoricola sp.]